ncbi:ATP-dependent RNA helicase DbpA [Pseudomaricurvus sp. HS19]|uniref:ATP-dependent RNA helicase DbpA n=1 Tax=Pseudomaricurvus sp. HS19 TaxID=2692626 RepID=UPI001F00DE33|nr:ATP-dependent RNA helicase DbpA [Pseudomaricurvus sp. HS19]
MTPLPFTKLPLAPELQATLSDLGYHTMTPVQAQSLPQVLAGRDIIAQAKTGSGKTAAFGLGLLAKLEVKRFCVQSLVLCPTRELADQVANEIRKLARGIHNIKVLTLCGGQPFGPQLGSLEHGAHIIVGTPGRVEEHLRKASLSLAQVDTLVLDEADRMLEMGFQASLDAIVEQTPAKRQTLLFSATYPTQIEAIAQRILREPVRVEVEEQHNADSIEQHFYNINDEAQRLLATRLLLLQFSPESAMVFANTKKEVQELCDTLCAHGFSAAALHGDMEQRDRDQTLIQFGNKSVSILVATDVAARGLDISAVDLVINYHLARDSEVHVHRVGRTGRGGSRGIACSLFSDKEHYKLMLLQDYLGHDIAGETLPDESILRKPPRQAAMTTLQIDGGKKQKIRPGDILGALTGEGGIDGDQVGKINMAPMRSYVAVKREVAKKALKILNEGKLKGRSCRARIISQR